VISISNNVVSVFLYILLGFLLSMAGVSILYFLLIMTAVLAIAIVAELK
jgi:hypothetical protein